MKNRRILAAVVFAILIFTYSSFAVYAEASSITLAVELDKEVYSVGDKAVASVDISRVSDDLINTELCGFQIHLAFDTDVLKYQSGEIVLGEKASLGVYGYNPGATNGAAGNIVALYSEDDGAILTAPEEGGTLVLKVEFEVIGSAATQSPLVWFSDELITPDCGYSCIMVDDGFTEIQCSFDNEAASAQTGSYVMYNPVAEYNPQTGKVAAAADVVLPSDKSGVLIAALYNVENENAPVFLAAKTDTVKGTENKPIEFENVLSAENLKVKYYLFDGFSVISPLALPTEAPVVSVGGQ